MNNKEIADISPFELTKIDGCYSSQVLGYNLTSTANIYVEDIHTQPDTKLLTDNIDKIADHLLKSNNPQLVISIHGYANKKSDTENRYKKIYNYATKICKSETIFVGYRWPAENPLKDDIQTEKNKHNSLVHKIKFAFEALPTLLLGTLITNLVLGVITIATVLSKRILTSNITITFIVVALIAIILGISINKLGKAAKFIPLFPNGLILVFLSCLICAVAVLSSNQNLSNLLLVPLAVVFALGCGVVFALMALRLSTYPSDRYRANNYGVVDMVEFIRQLDKAIFKKACLQQQISEAEWENIRSIDDEKLNKPRVKLSFINHSLGCEIVTQTVRILSDVFDPDAAKKPTNNLVIKRPSPDIGRVFSLGRLVLVAPDIPVESILSGRANFLRSSLRRCEEAYIFSNEADLALRVASTAANYFSFPATTRFRGYKLGNITVRHYKNREEKQAWKLDREDYGIVNLESADRKPYKYLEIRASNLEHIALKELASLKQPEDRKAEIERILEENAVADYFTYFDCTDYVDVEANLDDTNIANKNLIPKSLLSFALRKSALNFWWDYIRLVLAYFFNLPRHINVHGGYFDGEFTQKLIYELAFLGFQEVLCRNFNSELKSMSACCREKGIQVVLGSRLNSKMLDNCCDHKE